MRRAVALFALLAGCHEKVTFSDDPPWEETDPCPPIGEGKILVTNSGDDTLSWIDVPTLEVVCTAPAGRLPPEREGPHHGAALADGSAYFVGLSNYVPGSGSGPHGSHGTGSVDGYLLKYDMQTHELLGQRQVERSPGDVRLTPDQRYVLQSHFDLLRILEYLMAEGGDAGPPSPNSKLAVIDAATMAQVAMVEVCPAAHGIAVASDSSRAFVTCYGSDEVAIVTLAEPWDVERFRVGTAMAPLGGTPAYGPYAVSVEPDTGYLWVSDVDGQDVRVFDGTTLNGTPVSTSPGAPLFGDFWEGYYVAPLQGTNTLAFIDRTTRVAEQTTPLGGCIKPHAVYALDATRILVVCEGDWYDNPGSVVVVNTTTRVVDKALTVGVYPDDLVPILPP